MHMRRMMGRTLMRHGGVARQAGNGVTEGVGGLPVHL
jgi:hypothetical protein